MDLASHYINGLRDRTSKVKPVRKLVTRTYEDMRNEATATESEGEELRFSLKDCVIRAQGLHKNIALYVKFRKHLDNAMRKVERKLNRRASATAFLTRKTLYAPGALKRGGISLHKWGQATVFLPVWASNEEHLAQMIDARGRHGRHLTTTRFAAQGFSFRVDLSLGYRGPRSKTHYQMNNRLRRGYYLVVFVRYNGKKRSQLDSFDFVELVTDSVTGRW